MNKETTEQGRGEVRVTPDKILKKHIKGVSGLNDLTDWHKGFIYKAMKEYAEYTPSPANTSEQEKLWYEVKEVFMKHYYAYNYPSQAISELLTTYKISKR